MAGFAAILVALALANEFALRPALPGSLARDGGGSTILPTLCLALPLVALAWSAGLSRIPGSLGLVPAVVAGGLATAGAAALARSVNLPAPPPWSAATALAGIDCAVLTVLLIDTAGLAGPAQALAWGLGTAVAFGALCLAFAALRKHHEIPEVAPALRGPALALVTAGLIAIALGGFAGILRV